MPVTVPRKEEGKDKEQHRLEIPPHTNIQHSKDSVQGKEQFVSTLTLAKCQLDVIRDLVKLSLSFSVVEALTVNKLLQNELVGLELCKSRLFGRRHLNWKEAHGVRLIVLHVFFIKPLNDHRLVFTHLTLVVPFAYEVLCFSFTDGIVEVSIDVANDSKDDKSLNYYLYCRAVEEDVYFCYFDEVHIEYLEKATSCGKFVASKVPRVIQCILDHCHALFHLRHLSHVKNNRAADPREDNHLIVEIESLIVAQVVSLVGYDEVDNYQEDLAHE